MNRKQPPQSRLAGQRPCLPSRQHGITLWQVLLLVAVAVSLAVCAKLDKLPFSTSSITDNIRMPSVSFRDTSSRRTENWSEDLIENSGGGDNHYVQHRDDNTVARASLRTDRPQTQAAPAGTYDQQYPANLDSNRGYYTVQVFSGYNSKMAYDLRSSLKRDGYNTYITEEQTSQGILFKVRIGKYYNRSDAFAVSDKVRKRYPTNLGKSFVMLVENNP